EPEVMSAKPAVAPDRKITRDDIESKLRELQGEVGQRTEAAKVPAIAVAVGVGVVASPRQSRGAPPGAGDPRYLMSEPLLRSAWATSWRKARGGSRAWTIVA